MIRIPNPGSDIEMALRIFRDLYRDLGHASDFDLDDFSQAMVSRANATSQGAVGQEALRRSTRSDRSRDPLYNQSKSYAELFRTLGWLQSTSSALRYSFSFLGQHVAVAKDPRALVRECFLGLAYPNDVLAVKGDHSVRVFAAILRGMSLCDGKLSRDEIILGPMSLKDDRDPDAFKKTHEQILNLRRAGKVKNALAQLSGSIGITPITMGNYTRIPMAILPWSGWCVGNSGYLQLTDFGKAELARIEACVDFRLSDFRKLPVPAQQPCIRLSFYRMLGRCGFDVQPVQDQINADTSALNNLIPPGGWLFSPFQQIGRIEVNKAFALEPTSKAEQKQKKAEQSVLTLASSAHTEAAQAKLLFELTNNKLGDSQSTQGIADIIRHAAKRFGNSVQPIVAFLVQAYESANQDVFYPVVAELFRVLGFDCQKSRQGVNYERADAMIRDPRRSIPIEIKSPGEELEISVKAVRQAVENKIILLSRKSYPTTIDTTSLVVGYNRPNERSEVHELIEDVFKAYGFRIGVLDFKSLLTLAVASLLSGKQVALTNFENLKGVIDVTYS
jgi:hypothetical protein